MDNKWEGYNKFGIETTIDLDLIAAFKYIHQGKYNKSDKLLKQYFVPGKKLLIYEGQSDYFKTIVTLDKKLFEPINSYYQYALLRKTWMPMEFENELKAKISYEIQKKLFLDSKKQGDEQGNEFNSVPKTPDILPGKEILLMEYLTASSLYYVFSDLNKRIKKEDEKTAELAYVVKNNMLNRIMFDLVYLNTNALTIQENMQIKQDYYEKLVYPFKKEKLLDRKLKKNIDKLSKIYSEDSEFFFWDSAPWNILIDYKRLVENLKNYIDVSKEISDSVYLNRYSFEKINDYILNKNHELSSDNIISLFTNNLYHIDFSKADRKSFWRDDFSHITDIYGHLISIGSTKDITDKNINKFLQKKQEMNNIFEKRIMNKHSRTSEHNSSLKNSSLKKNNLFSFYRNFRLSFAEYSEPIDEKVVSQAQVMSNLYLDMAKNNSFNVDTLKGAYINKKCALRNVSYLLRNINFDDC